MTNEEFTEAEEARAHARDLRDAKLALSHPDYGLVILFMRGAIPEEARAKLREALNSVVSEKVGGCTMIDNLPGVTVREIEYRLSHRTQKALEENEETIKWATELLAAEEAKNNAAP